MTESGSTQPPELRAGDIVLARFTPARTDDLKAEAILMVGEMFLWVTAREVEDNPGYNGQWRMELCDSDHKRTGIWWVPLCDLSEVTVVGVDKRAASLYAMTHPDEARS